MKTLTDKNWSRDFAKVIEDMCCQSLEYQREIRVEGLLAITLDGSNVVVVNVNRQTKGQNSTCVVPRFTATSEQADTVTPMLNKLFSGMSCVTGQPAHVAVTGLGTSNLVGQLIISNSPDRKVPQAKLILNEQNLPVSTCSEKSDSNEKKSVETKSNKASNGSPGGNFNTNNSVSASGNTAGNTAKKSLDSVIAKLHHQTSKSESNQSKLQKNPVSKKSQPPQATIVRRTPQQQPGVKATESTVKDTISSSKAEPKVATIVRKVKERSTEEKEIQPPVKRQRVESETVVANKEAKSVVGTNDKGPDVSTCSSRNSTPLRDSASSSGRSTPSIQAKTRAKATPTRDIPPRQVKAQPINDKAEKIQRKDSSKPRKTSEKRTSIRVKKPKDLFAPDDSPRTTYMAEKLLNPGRRITRQRKVVSSKVISKKTSIQSQAQKIVKKHQQQQRERKSSSESKQGGVLRSKNMCNKCVNCKRENDCKKCLFCLDKPKYGGKNTLRQKCIKRQCIRLSRVLQKMSEKAKNQS